MKTIKEYEGDILKYTKNADQVQDWLTNIIGRIKFLESIYMTGGELSYFSDKFRDSAHEERQELCKESSAGYNILREVYKIKE